MKIIKHMNEIFIYPCEEPVKIMIKKGMILAKEISPVHGVFISFAPVRRIRWTKLSFKWMIINAKERLDKWWNKVRGIS